MRVAPVLASTLLLLAAACDGKPPSDRPMAATSTSARAPQPKAPTAASSSLPSSLPQGITEEEFKAMHEPVHIAATPPRGTMIDLAGTKAYLSLPEGARPPFPGVTVVHEWWGLNDNIKLWCDRLAKDGYAALAVDLYGGVVATDADAAMKAMQAVDQDKALKTLLAAHAFLRDDPRVKATRRASIGWCFGGGQSYQLAMHAPDLDACVMYYGRFSTDPKELAAIKAPLLGIFANLDQGIPPKDVNAFDAALTKAGVTHRILRYDADHAFANPSGSHYDEEDAKAAWAEVRAFLAEKLKR